MNNTIESKTFRDRPINIDQEGKRKWIYAKQPKGKWYTRRTIFGWFFLLFLLLAPFIKIKGHPFMLIDIASRKFYLFGIMVWAQDTFIVTLIMVITVVSIVLFTVAFGRLWCGWACPQTVFLEMVFRKIEYLFDGNYRNGKPKKGSAYVVPKHAAFILTSILITNVLLMWFIGPSGLKEIVTDPISEHWLGFLIMLGLSLFYYWIYAFFREQVCTMICPYGRLQGVLLDSKSISVVYDYKRGEPRGAKTEGHCVDCGQCLAVCPTGIDIRNGSQLECINCTACIDECNLVMSKVNKPGNLIRYDSMHGIETGKRNFWTPRIIGYSSVLAVLFVVLIISISSRTITDSTILRMPGTMFQEVSETTISNIYNAKIINKSSDDKHLNLRLITPAKGMVEVVGQEFVIKGNEVFEGVILIKLEKEYLEGKSTKIELGIYEGDILLESKKMNFIGPGQ